MFLTQFQTEALSESQTADHDKAYETLTLHEKEIFLCGVRYAVKQISSAIRCRNELA